MGPSFRVYSAVSGELLAEAVEFDSKPIRELKNDIAKQVGASRFQQRWFHEDNRSGLTLNTWHAAVPARCS